MCTKILLLFFGFLLLNTATGFSRDSCKRNSDSKAIDGALCVGSVIHDKFALAQKFIKTTKFIKALVVKGAALLQKNRVFLAASIVFDVVRTMMNSHSLTIGTRKEHMAARFDNDELNMIMEAEITPMLEIAEMILTEGGTRTGMKQFCEGKHLFREKLDRVINDLHAVRKRTELKLIEVPNSGEGMDNIWTTIKNYIGTDNEDKKEKAIDVLQHIRSNALMAENSLRKARAEVDNVCIKFMMSRESNLTEWFREGTELMKKSLTPLLAYIGMKTSSKDEMYEEL